MDQNLWNQYKMKNLIEFWEEVKNETFFSYFIIIIT